MVSVIITSFNYGQYIERAIRSCLSQSLPRNQYEIIVVDDASTDGTHKILDNYKDEIKVIRLEKNVGLSAARNAGVRASRGQFVIFIDADDYIQGDMLLVQKTFLSENSRLDAVAVDYIRVDEFGDHMECVSAGERPIACGIMFRKDLLFNIGLYDESFRAREEEDLRIRFEKKYSIYNIILPLYRYRMHGKNLTNNTGEMNKFARKLQTKHKATGKKRKTKKR
jgi:glycosyltransferase involved in cell wall biosynthesis